MSNRKRAKNRRLLAERALAKQRDLIQANVQQQMHIVASGEDGDKKEELKRVPALADGVEIGTTIIYDDGSVDIIIAPDAPPEAVAKVKALEEEMRFMGLKEE